MTNAQEQEIPMIDCESVDEAELVSIPRRQPVGKVRAVVAFVVCAVVLMGTGVAWLNAGSSTQLTKESSTQLTQLFFKKHKKKQEDSKESSDDSAEAEENEEIPDCLKDMQKPTDFDKCSESMLKSLKKAGGSDYEYALAENLLNGKPLSPKHLAQQTKELTKQNSLAANKMLEHAKKQSKALAKASKALLKSNSKKMAKLTGDTSKCILAGAACNKKCHKDGSATCVHKCTEDHTACLNKANGIRKGK